MPKTPRMLGISPKIKNEVKIKKTGVKAIIGTERDKSLIATDRKLKIVIKIFKTTVAKTDSQKVRLVSGNPLITETINKIIEVIKNAPKAKIN